MEALSRFNGWWWSSCGGRLGPEVQTQCQQWDRLLRAKSHTTRASVRLFDPIVQMLWCWGRMLCDGLRQLLAAVASYKAEGSRLITVNTLIILIHTWYNMHLLYLIIYRYWLLIYGFWPFVMIWKLLPLFYLLIGWVRLVVLGLSPAILPDCDLRWQRWCDRCGVAQIRPFLCR